MAELSLVQYRSTDPRASVDVSLANPLPVTGAVTGSVVVTSDTDVQTLTTLLTSIAQKSAREIRDVFSRPNDASPYSLNDVIAATIQNTATTPLRPLALALSSGKPFAIPYWLCRTNLTTFLCTLRVHLYAVANPAAAPNSGTALVGDNVSMIQTEDNIGVRIGSFDLTAFTLSHAGDGYVSAGVDYTVSTMPFFVMPTDGSVYYRYEIISGTPTPAALQKFYTIVRSVDL